MFIDVVAIRVIVIVIGIFFMSKHVHLFDPNAHSRRPELDGDLASKRQRSCKPEPESVSSDPMLTRQLQDRTWL